jgi:S1-C subfamily serine protease
MRRASWIAAAAAALAGCGGDGDGATRTVTTEKTEVRVVRPSAPAQAGAFDPAAIYAREAPGVVTIYSVGEGGIDADTGGLGSGFVLNGDGEIATNAHVVTSGEGSDIEAVEQVYVEFSDGNRVPAEIRGFDADADVALLELDPEGLDLRPLPLGDSDAVRVGEPVAAIGSPFGERQSLSVGIVSAVDRDAQSLTRFSIPGAIQTDAAINPGNSGGPLVDAEGRVIGLNQSIESRSGSGAGVGFAVPINLAKRSIDDLREDGEVEYAFLGVTTTPVYPQLADRFGLPVDQGAWIQELTADGPADEAGLRSGSGEEITFQAVPVKDGGDVIVKVGPFAIDDPNDLSEAVARLEPGREVPVVVMRDGERRTIPLTLGRRPGG